jgi:hypothetical protein
MHANAIQAQRNVQNTEKKQSMPHATERNVREQKQIVTEQTLTTNKTQNVSHWMQENQVRQETAQKREEYPWENPQSINNNASPMTEQFPSALGQPYSTIIVNREIPQQTNNVYSTVEINRQNNAMTELPPTPGYPDEPSPTPLFSPPYHAILTHADRVPSPSYQSPHQEVPTVINTTEYKPERLYMNQYEQSREDLTPSYFTPHNPRSNTMTPQDSNGPFKNAITFNGYPRPKTAGELKQDHHWLLACLNRGC